MYLQRTASLVLKLRIFKEGENCCCLAAYDVTDGKWTTENSKFRLKEPVHYKGRQLKLLIIYKLATPLISRGGVEVISNLLGRLALNIFHYKYCFSNWVLDETGSDNSAL